MLGSLSSACASNVRVNVSEVKSVPIILHAMAKLSLTWPPSDCSGYVEKKCLAA